MVHSPDQRTVMRDTIFAVIMIILNGMVGTALHADDSRPDAVCLSAGIRDVRRVVRRVSRPFFGRTPL
jgi:hypothetical protein